MALEIQKKRKSKQVQLEKEKGELRKFPCGPVIRTLSFTAAGVVSIPDGGTKIQANHTGQLEKKKKRKEEKKGKKGQLTQESPQQRKKGGTFLG